MIGDERDRGRVEELETIRRFEHAWERAASLALRAGDASILAVYDEHDRIAGGTREEMLDHAFAIWRDARDSAREVVVMAGDNETVDELALRIRADRVQRGEVEREGIRTERSVVGKGDEIVTLRNDRSLRTTEGEWVRNGERWLVTDRHDGALTVDSLDGRGSVTLPGKYVHDHVTLAYALTVHKAQGMTIDAGVLIADDRTTAEQLYVGMSRGREENVVVVIADVLDPDHGEHKVREPMEVLRGSIERRGNERSAHEVMREELARYEQPRLRDEIAEETRRRIDRLAGPDRREEIAAIERKAPDGIGQWSRPSLTYTHARNYAQYFGKKRAKAAEHLALVRKEPPGRDRDSALRAAEVQLAEVKRQEQAALRRYESARFAEGEKTDLGRKLNNLRQDQAAREAWLDRHPEERDWLAEFERSDAERWQGEDLERELQESSQLGGPRHVRVFGREYEIDDYSGRPTARDLRMDPDDHFWSQQMMEPPGMDIGGPELLP